LAVIPCSRRPHKKAFLQWKFEAAPHETSEIIEMKFTP